MLKVLFSYRYSEIFNTNHNLSFRNPRTDTCNTCDELRIQGENPTESDHQKEAERCYKQMADDQKEGSMREDTLFLVFDLEKTQPLPKVSTNKAFYLRQLWLYNLVMHYTHKKDDNAIMCIWLESEGGRGVDEIGSCLMRFFEIVGSSERVLVWSDSCAGQNKNQFILFIWLWLVHNGDIGEVIHSFPVVGHSYNASDRDSSLLEAMFKKSEFIFDKSEYRDLIVRSKRQNPFKVVDMKGKFYNIKEFCKSMNLINRTKNDKGEKIRFREIRQIKIMKSKPGSYEYRYSMLGDWNTVTVLSMRRSRGNPQDTILPQLKPDVQRAINTKKIEDIQKLLPFVPQMYHDFYKSLRGTDCDSDTE